MMTTTTTSKGRVGLLQHRPQPEVPTSGFWFDFRNVDCNVVAEYNGSESITFTIHSKSVNFHIVLGTFGADEWDEMFDEAVNGNMGDYVRLTIGNPNYYTMYIDGGIVWLPEEAVEKMHAHAWDMRQPEHLRHGPVT